jgi:hypothetical protein
MTKTINKMGELAQRIRPNTTPVAGIISDDRLSVRCGDNAKTNTQKKETTTHMALAL